MTGMNNALVLNKIYLKSEYQGNRNSLMCLIEPLRFDGVCRFFSDFMSCIAPSCYIVVAREVIILVTVRRGTHTCSLKLWLFTLNLVQSCTSRSVHRTANTNLITIALCTNFFHIILPVID